jgi:hypothetical protein
MASVAHSDKQAKQKVAVTEFVPAQQKVMHTAQDQPASKNVKIHRAQIHFPERSGNVAVKNQ